MHMMAIVYCWELAGQFLFLTESLIITAEHISAKLNVG